MCRDAITSWSYETKSAAKALLVEAATRSAREHEAYLQAQATQHHVANMHSGVRLLSRIGAHHIKSKLPCVVSVWAKHTREEQRRGLEAQLVAIQLAHEREIKARAQKEAEQYKQIAALQTEKQTVLGDCTRLKKHILLELHNLYSLMSWMIV